MNPIHFSYEPYLPFSMVNYSAPPSQTNSLSYIMLPLTPLAEGPSLVYSDSILPTSLCQHVTIVPVYNGSWLTLTSPWVLQSSCPHCPSSLHQHPPQSALLSFETDWPETSHPLLLHEPTTQVCSIHQAENFRLAFYSEKDIFVLQRHAEPVPIDVLQERQAGKIGHVEPFLFRLWCPWWLRDRGNDLPGTWQPLPFGKQPLSFLCSCHHPLTSPSSKPCQIPELQTFSKFKGKTKKKYNHFLTRTHLSQRYQCQKNHLAYLPNHPGLEQLHWNFDFRVGGDRVDGEITVLGVMLDDVV